MEAKLVLVLSLVAATHGSWSQSGFSYDVANSETNDYKSQLETRVGDAVYGHYTLQEPDGSKRIVSYFADKDGFNADVRQSPSGAARIAEPAAAIAAPAAAVIAAPAAVAPAAVVARAPAFVPGVVDARIYPAFYRTGPSVYSSWPYGL